MDEWQSLDTAPKDGSTFLAFTADYMAGVRFNCRVQEAKWSGKTPDDRIGHFKISKRSDRSALDAASQAARFIVD